MLGGCWQNLSDRKARGVTETWQRERREKKKSMDPGTNRNRKQDPGYLLSSVTVMFKPAEGWPRWSGSEGVKTGHLQVDACKVAPTLFNTLKCSEPFHVLTLPPFFFTFQKEKTHWRTCLYFVCLTAEEAESVGTLGSNWTHFEAAAPESHLPGKK